MSHMKIKVMNKGDVRTRAGLETTDIVDRLRHKLAPRMDVDEIEGLWSEAADEIEHLRARVALLEGEARIGADRLLIASGVCREWADRMRAMDGNEPPHAEPMMCEACGSQLGDSVIMRRCDCTQMQRPVPVEAAPCPDSPHRGNVECEGRLADTASRLDP